MSTGGLGAVFRDAPERVARRGAAIERRLTGLSKAVEAARGRLDEALLDDVDTTVERASGRLRLSSRHTVVAIAGATGSGKSTTFNALAGADLSVAGAKRPTTSTASALVWTGEEGDEELTELLDWFGVRPEARFWRTALPSAAPRNALPEGLVLLDLPDHDSIQAAHHEEAERVVALADALIWVVDPQKYADAAIHERFLRPMAGHRDVTMVVLNHIDTVPEDQRPDLLRDLRKLLVADGIRDPRTIAISARSGLGVTDLRTAISRRVEEHRNAERRAEADVAAAALKLREASGEAPATVPDPWVADLERRIGEAAGRGCRGPVDRPAVNGAVRAFTDLVCRDLAEAWAAPLREAATARLRDTTDRLDAELAALPPLPAVRERGGRWRAIRRAAATAVGLRRHLDRRRAADEASRLDAAADEGRRVVARVARGQVVAPVQAELASYARFRAGLDAAVSARASR